MKNKTVAMLLLFALLVSFAAPASAEAAKKPTTNMPKKLTLYGWSPNSMTKEFSKYQGFVIYFENARSSPEFTFSDSGIVRIAKEQDGYYYIKPLRAGETTVTMKIGSTSFNCNVNVIDASTKVYVNSYSWNNNGITISVGKINKYGVAKVTLKNESPVTKMFGTVRYIGYTSNGKEIAGLDGIIAHAWHRTPAAYLSSYDSGVKGWVKAGYVVPAKSTTSFYISRSDFRIYDYYYTTDDIAYFTATYSSTESDEGYVQEVKNPDIEIKSEIIKEGKTKYLDVVINNNYKDDLFCKPLQVVFYLKGKAVKVVNLTASTYGGTNGENLPTYETRLVLQRGENLICAEGGGRITVPKKYDEYKIINTDRFYTVQCITDGERVGWLINRPVY